MVSDRCYIISIFVQVTCNLHVIKYGNTYSAFLQEPLSEYLLCLYGRGEELWFPTDVRV